MLEFCRLEVWHISHWIKIKASAGLHSLLEAKEKNLFDAVSSFYKLPTYFGSWPPSSIFKVSNTAPLWLFCSHIFLSSEARVGSLILRAHVIRFGTPGYSRIVSSSQGPHLNHTCKVPRNTVYSQILWVRKDAGIFGCPLSCLPHQVCITYAILSVKALSNGYAVWFKELFYFLG